MYINRLNNNFAHDNQCASLGDQHNVGEVLSSHTEHSSLLIDESNLAFESPIRIKEPSEVSSTLPTLVTKTPPSYNVVNSYPILSLVAITCSFGGFVTSLNRTLRNILRVNSVLYITL
jgi:hypothetical protein